MATISVSLSGSSIINVAKSYTVSDPDIQSILNWVQIVYGPYLAATYNPTSAPGFVPTSQQLLLAWVQQTLIETTKAGVRQSQTPTVVVPPPITIS